VDDILIAGDNSEINKTKKLIKRKFKIKEIGDVDFVIGIKFIKHKNGYFINQISYIKELLKKFEMTNEKPLRNLSPVENAELRQIKFNETRYRSAVGNLLYLGINTRPDILFAVNKAARKSTNPTLEDWYNIKRIFRYLINTMNYGINYTKNNTIKAYTDADYAGDVESRKSTSGFVIMIGDSPTSWCSKLQHSVSTSTAEAEYYSLSECGKQYMWYMIYSRN